MDNTLLAVGRWTDDRIPNERVTMRPTENGKDRQYGYLSTKPHNRTSRSNHEHRLSNSEDELLDRPPKTAIKEVRATQMIRRQHPAYFVKAEAGQRGNEATAKPPGNLSRVERSLLKLASTYVLVDEHEGREKPSST
jgi:hypothetical protein